jgi:hypothetical protein
MNVTVTSLCSQRNAFVYTVDNLPAICLFVRSRRSAPRAYTDNLGNLRVRTP